MGCIIVLGTGLGLAALAFAPQSIIAPLGGLTIVWNLLLSGSVTRAQVLGTLVTMMGMALVIWFGPSPQQQQTQQKTTPFALLAKPTFELLVAVYLTMCATMETAKSNLTLSRFWRRIAAGAVGGVVGGLSNVFAKSAIEYYSQQQQSMAYFQFYLVVCIALLLAGAQIALFNQALASFPVITVVPVYMTSLMIFSTVSGGVAFDEFKNFGVLRSLAFCSGMLTCVCGVAFLSSSSPMVSAVDEEAKD